MLARHQHVGGLDVAVHEPARVGGLERRGHLGHDLRRARRRQRAFGRDQRPQVVAGDEAHREVEHPVLLARPEDGEDVGMVERRREARLDDEALAEAAVARELRRDQLERHPAVQRELDRLVDDAHAAAPDHPLEAVAGDHGAEGGLDHDPFLPALSRPVGT